MLAAKRRWDAAGTLIARPLSRFPQATYGVPADR